MKSLFRGGAAAIACFAASRRAIALHGRGGLDDVALQRRLRCIDRRRARLRRLHWTVDMVVELQVRPFPVQRPVLWLLALAIASSVVRCV